LNAFDAGWTRVELQSALSDAIIITQAMKASTIMEVFIGGSVMSPNRCRRPRSVGSQKLHQMPQLALPAARVVLAGFLGGEAGLFEQ
jgi:hypothetical protein